MTKPIDKKTLSQVMSALSRRRKHPYASFRDTPGLASTAGKRGWTAERRQQQAERIKQYRLDYLARKQHEDQEEAADAAPDAEAQA